MSHWATRIACRTGVVPTAEGRLLAGADKLPPARGGTSIVRRQIARKPHRDSDQWGEMAAAARHFFISRRLALTHIIFLTRTLRADLWAETAAAEHGQ